MVDIFVSAPPAQVILGTGGLSEVAGKFDRDLSEE
jgi:hypothetical protein